MVHLHYKASQVQTNILRMTSGFFVINIEEYEKLNSLQGRGSYHVHFDSCIIFVWFKCDGGTASVTPMQTSWREFAASAQCALFTYYNNIWIVFSETHFNTDLIKLLACFLTRAALVHQDFNCHSFVACTSFWCLAMECWYHSNEEWEVVKIWKWLSLEMLQQVFGEHREGSCRSLRSSKSKDAASCWEEAQRLC